MKAKYLKGKIRRLFKPRVNVAMVHIGRCGSSVLARMLNAHDEVHWASEIYESYFQLWRKQGLGFDSPIGFSADPVLLLKDAVESRPIKDYFGFEIKPFHNRLIGVQFDDYINRIASFGFSHFIILDRINRLKVIVSALIAHQPKNSYHLMADEKASLSPVYIDVDAIEIDYDKKSLLGFLQDYDEQFSQVNKTLSGPNVLRLNYEEDIEKDPGKAYLKVCNYINLSPDLSRNVDLRKTNPYPLKDLIKNYDEVCECLGGTQYEWMLQG
jgi:hypothetical protein